MGCSKDENSNSSKNAKVNNYLARFYKKNFYIGNSVETAVVKSPTLSFARTTLAKSEEFEGIKLSEVFVGEDERARGYIVTDKDTNEFLYFADVDRENFKFTKVDINANLTEELENIQQLDKYNATNQLDLIKIVQELKDGNLQNDEALAQIVSTTSFERIYMQFFHIYADGCWGTHSYHSAFFGIFKWETYEVVGCP
ncbi:MAG: hypothetical protein H7250_06050 [Flavobacterium sp.]|nr:hypothetical protein [Flavobacterium sp.]